MGLQTTLLLPILSILSLIFLPSPLNATEGNILVTGEVLPTGGKLYYEKDTFVMQDDCNLVLYNNFEGFQSGTHGLGTDCTLTLSDHGNLFIKNGRGSIIWSTGGRTMKGKYVAVLDPHGDVNVFGPTIWSSTPLLSSSCATAEDQLNSTPLETNVLFSWDNLEEKKKLESGDYSFELTEECNVELRKASVGVVWQSNTKGKGRRCALTLDDRGRLVVVDGDNVSIWETEEAGAEGEYVLVLQINGQAVVYGPEVWSTASSVF